jgi:hypothetical protein
MILRRRKLKIKWNFKIYLNNKKLQEEDTIQYSGIIIDRRFSFNEHIEHITGKRIKLIQALSKSVKINWGLRHDVLRIIHTGAILTILAYATRNPRRTRCHLHHGES